MGQVYLHCNSSDEQLLSHYRLSQHLVVLSRKLGQLGYSVQI